MPVAAAAAAAPKGAEPGDLGGITGYVNVDGTPYCFNKWKLSIKNKAPDTSGFCSAGFGQNARGKTTGTITLSGPYNGQMPLCAGVVYDFVLGFKQGLFLDVSARVTELTPGDDYEDKPTLDVTAESYGPFSPCVE